MKTTTLPDKPSELILVALADLEAVEKDPAYTVDMAKWHRFEGGTCFVCLAGAVLAKTVGLYPQETVGPHSVKTEISDKMRALDSFRTGDVAGGLWYLEAEGEGIQSSMTVPLYDSDPAGFKGALRQIAEMLATHNL